MIKVKRDNQRATVVGGGVGGVEWEKVAKRYKLPIKKKGKAIVDSQWRYHIESKQIALESFKKVQLQQKGRPGQGYRLVGKR